MTVFCPKIAYGWCLLLLSRHEAIGCLILLAYISRLLLLDFDYVIPLVEVSTLGLRSLQNDSRLMFVCVLPLLHRLVPNEPALRFNLTVELPLPLPLFTLQFLTLSLLLAHACRCVFIHYLLKTVLQLLSLRKDPKRMLCVLFL
jgi:hypothetical protein